MPPKFIDALAGTTPITPALPLVHTTSSPDFEYEIGPNSVLKAQKCKVYAEDLVYFFYGKPSYRPQDSDTLHKAEMKQFAPVCLVLDVPSGVVPKRVMPFDSGAYHNGVMSREGHAHRRLKKEYFELQDRDAPGGIVNVFFGSNLDYFNEKPLSVPTVDPATNTCVESYVSLISRTGTNQGDSRLNSIEIQFGQDIDLGIAGTVLAVAMAEPLYQDRKEIQGILTAWGAEPLLYDLNGRFRPGECCATIERYVREFLKRQGCL